MQTQSIRMALLSAAVLASPLFAGTQFDKKMPGMDVTANTRGVVRAVQQGKDTGMTRSDVVIRANAWLVEPAYDEPSRVESPRPAGLNYNDTQAFHK